MPPEQLTTVVREVLESAFRLDARIHANQLPELRGCEIEADIHPSRDGKPPALVLSIEWPTDGTGPVRSTRQRLDGLEISTLIECDLMNVTERELAAAATLGAPITLTDADAAKLFNHVRLNGTGGARILELMNKAAALCVVPTVDHATQLNVDAVFRW